MMSRRRIAAAIAAVAALLALVGWRAHRERLVARCLETGGQWIGAASHCAPDPNRITIRRELYRS